MPKPNKHLTVDELFAKAYAKPEKRIVIKPNAFDKLTYKVNVKINKNANSKTTTSTKSNVRKG